MLRRWIVWTSYFGFFTAGLFFLVGTVHLLFFYVVMVLNLGLLALAGSLWFPPSLVFFLGFTLLSGMVGVAQGTDSVALLMKSLVGIWLTAFYVCALLRFLRFDAVECFRRYAVAAYYMVVFGLIVYPAQLAMFGFAARFRSFEIEPGELCVVCLPAIYHFADRWQRGRGDGGKVLVMLLAVALSRSSIGFMGLLVGTYLFSRRYRFGSLAAPVVVALMGVAIYAVSLDFQLRLNDSVMGFTQQDASDLNGSSLSQVSGAYVAVKAMEAHTLMGEGLGGISLVNHRYIDGLPGASLLPEDTRYVAAGDGGSLLFRLMGETGLVGLGLAFGFLWFCYPRGANAERQQTAQAILLYTFAKLLRSGSYLNPEVLFLFTVYAVNGSHVLHEVRRGIGLRWKRHLQEEEGAQMLPTEQVAG